MKKMSARASDRSDDAVLRQETKQEREEGGGAGTAFPRFHERRGERTMSAARIKPRDPGGCIRSGSEDRRRTVRFRALCKEAG